MSAAHTPAGAWRTWLRKEAETKVLRRALWWEAQQTLYRKSSAFSLLLLLLLLDGCVLPLPLPCLTSLGQKTNFRPQLCCEGRKSMAPWLLYQRRVTALHLYIVRDSQTGDWSVNRSWILDSPNQESVTIDSSRTQGDAFLESRSMRHREERRSREQWKHRSHSREKQRWDRLEEQLGT